MSEEQTVTYELEGEIALVGLNRPDKRNCFNPTVMKQLREAIERAGEEAKCGIIFGHGDNFCAGLDLRWAAESWKTGRSERLPFQFNRNTYFEAMARGNIPFIAALHGATLGGGLETAAAAHIRVADETTFFALPEGTRGIFIGGGGSVRVARLLGFARMQDMMLTGRVLKPDEAERYGIVQYVVPEGTSDGQGEGAGGENLQERAAVEFRHHQQPAAAAGHVLRRRPVLRAHGGGIHPQPGVDRAAAPVPRQDRAARPHAGVDVRREWAEAFSGRASNGFA